MAKKIAICPGCHTKIPCEGEVGQKVKIKCPNCGKTGSIAFKSELIELDFYPLNEPYSYAKVLKDNETYDRAVVLNALALNGNEVIAQKILKLFEKDFFSDSEIEQVANTFVNISRSFSSKLVQEYSNSSKIKERQLAYSILKNIENQ